MRPVRFATAAAAMVFAFCVWTRSAAGDEPDPVRILLIYTPPDHPYGSHMYEHECRLLAKCLEQSAGVDAEVAAWPVDPGRLKGVDCLVFYTSPAADLVLHDSRRSEFMKLMESGVGYVAIHWATKAGKPENVPVYLRLLGGCFSYGSSDRPHLAVTEERLRQVDPTHPICRGWAEYDLRDEWYLAMKFSPRARPLLKVTVRADEKAGRPEPIDRVIAWTFEREGHNGGRSFGVTLGHFHENFGIEAFRRMLVNGILWAARIEIPSLGAPVAVDDSDLILPPPPAAERR